MIAQIRGKVVEKYGTSIIVDVSGVGYEVILSSLEYERSVLEMEVKLYTYHHVREQSEELFGFSSLAGKKLFELLISVQGIGPKGAMAVLSLGEAEEVRNAIANADAEFIAKASGIGKKSADGAIVKLRDKVGLPVYYGRKAEMDLAEVPTEDEAMEALMALGYNLADATKALGGIDAGLSTAERVKLALRG